MQALLCLGRVKLKDSVNRISTLAYPAIRMALTLLNFYREHGATCLRERLQQTLYIEYRGKIMLKKTIAASLLLSVVAVAAFANQADAKRRCPRGYEDINNVCVYTGHR